MQGQIEDRGFVRLMFAAAVVTFLMIIIGAITRVTESGMGCGPYWPSCNGLLVPEFERIDVVIEFGHRLFALAVGGFTIAAAVLAHRRYRAEPRLYGPAMAAVALFFGQSAVGALTVAVYNQWVSVLLHLSVALGLFASFVIGWINARALLLPVQVNTMRSGRSLPFVEVLLATALSYLVIVVGAAVAGTNATRACIGWPFCGGQIWPAEQGQLQILNMVHRLIAGTLGIVILVMCIQAFSGGQKVNKALKTALLVSLVMYLTQAAVGALMVSVEGRDWLTVARGAHVPFGALTWAALVAASTIAWLQLSPVGVRTTQSAAIAVSSATTSS